MAFGKKKKTEELVTPHDVAKLGHEHEVAAAKDSKSSVYDHFHAQDSAKEIANAKKRKKRYAIILGTLIGVLLIIYIISMLTTQWGDLVVSVENGVPGKTILLSESADFSSGNGVKLNGGSVKEVTNITKAWLPKNLEDKDGSHNGKNHLAYTFYLKNTGDEDLEYETNMTLTGQSKGADEACRIMVFKNGKESVYAKGTKASEGKKAETDATKWKTNDTILTVPKSTLKAKAQDKYTVVIWIEGNDRECVDAIRGGHIRSQMTFSVLSDEDKTS